MRDHLDAIANLSFDDAAMIMQHKMADTICVVNAIRVSNDDLLSVCNIMYLTCNIFHSLWLIGGCIIEINCHII